MKLKSFRVINYRSIIDSKECFLSPNDGITILAGQNESGKSSLLEALSHYENGTPCLEAYRDEDITDYPWVYCTYTVEEDDGLYDEIHPILLRNEKFKDLLLIEKLDEYLKGIKEVTLQRAIGHSPEKVYGIALQNDATLASIIKLIKIDEKYKLIGEVNIRAWLGQAIFKSTPKIILFDEFFDILPDKFFLDELDKDTKPKGLQAVKNVEAILETDFSELSKASDLKANKQQREYEAVLTADFNERWKQRIGDETGATISVSYHQGGTEGRPYLRFSIQTRKDEFLPPDKRSLGFKWFLSFYLHLTAESKRKSNLVLLFDEPGLHLHSKAQNDMLKVFEELSVKNHIIYATHSPYLIDGGKLHRVRLIFNSKDDGTIVEKITTKISANQKDAIKPIIDALGMQVAHNFSAAKDKNVIVEGISDHYYLSAAKKLLHVEDDFYFMPAMGAPNAHLLMELCIGWGLKWLMIFDDSKDSNKDIKKIKTQFFPDDNTVDKKIHILTGCDGIEDVFETEDIKLINPEFTRTSGAISKDLKAYGGKELIGRFFLDKVASGEITWDKLSPKAQNNFKQVMLFIERGFQ